MTFSLVARDPNSGAFGSVICSSSPAVAARCVHLADGIGAVHSQNVTDPRLGPRLLSLLATGQSAEQTLQTVRESEPTLAWRQLLVVDAAGGAAVHSGSHALGTVGERTGDGVVAAGNMLATELIPSLMVERWSNRPEREPLEETLMAVLETAVEAGGEAGPVHSAGLSVISGLGWRVTDLRVDLSDSPIAELRRLLQVWLPQRDDYIQRALDPDASPGYGVPGDER